MIKINIHSDPPTAEQVSSTKKRVEGRRNMIVRYFKFGLPVILLVFVIYFLKAEDADTFIMTWIAVGISMISALLYTGLVETEKQLSLLSDPSNPEIAVGLCKKNDVCDKYRLKVIDTGRALIDAEVKMFEHFAEESSTKSSRDRAIDQLSTKNPLISKEY